MKRSALDCVYSHGVCCCINAVIYWCNGVNWFGSYNGVNKNEFAIQVLTQMTMPTLQANGFWNQAVEGKVQFVSGDWKSASQLLDKPHYHAGEGLPDSGGSFDLILTADTIYR